MALKDSLQDQIMRVSVVMVLVSMLAGLCVGDHGYHDHHHVPYHQDHGYHHKEHYHHEPYYQFGYGVHAYGHGYHVMTFPCPNIEQNPLLNKC